MKAFDIFQSRGCGFYCKVNGHIAEIITNNPNGMCLWAEWGGCYMEVDCPDRDNMNARFEAEGGINNKVFPYSLKGFEDACSWFDEQRSRHGHKIADS